jgi:hypothetical protein
MTGDFERAVTKWRWGLKLLKLPRRMGVSIITVHNVAEALADHANRATFNAEGQIHAFPSLARLAFMLRLNEKTVRRALEILEEFGYFRRRHRFENSNVYELLVPNFAEEYAVRCLDLLSNPRVRECPSCPKDTEDMVKKSRPPGQICQETGKNVQLPLTTSDLHSISKSIPSECIAIIKPRDLVKEKRLSEGLQALKAELSRSPDPLLNCSARQRAKPEGQQRLVLSVGRARDGEAGTPNTTQRD